MANVRDTARYQVSIAGGITTTDFYCVGTSEGTEFWAFLKFDVFQLILALSRMLQINDRKYIVKKKQFFQPKAAQC